MKKDYINIYFDKRRFLTSCELVYKNQLFNDHSIIGGLKMLVVIGIISLNIILFLKNTLLFYLGVIGTLLIIGIIFLIIIGTIQTKIEFRQHYSKIINGFDLNMRFLYNQEYFELYSFNDVNNTFNENWARVTNVIFIAKTNSLILNLKDGDRIFIIPSEEELWKLKSLSRFINELGIEVLELYQNDISPIRLK